jgi:hypothetical protein
MISPTPKDGYARMRSLGAGRLFERETTLKMKYYESGLWNTKRNLILIPTTSNSMHRIVFQIAQFRTLVKVY